ncbi:MULTISPECIES: amidase [Rhodococcus]|uniref:amidase n=1 Tax=Rhodococcus oxybenzonivorans TaxID=1990687 RepID=A0AAE4V2P6_9NOCA|nr:MULTISPECIES: amidase [Rhodococcus]MDV7243058.1 amidase [Rhodococcus oxybenzonivorans]MDV7267302.1 amidase [Rhodococcus oxybenzonivorans]MDV7275462.1 amidase [Rhodococcus oxybenzonivorans]MDV7334683.1 amidase [Rhodococcus oxybenzonivorans]MDV7344837.1 amidase [Rhodococcus oxybenzonivorans]
MTDNSTPRKDSAVHAFRDDALGDLDATGIAERIASKEVSVREVTEAAIARAESVEPLLCGLAFPDFDRALTESGRPHEGVFAGVPTVIKDNVDVAGQPTQHGSAAFTATPARADSDFVAQYLSTGIVSLGKSRLPEFGFSASTEFMDAEPVHNPWNLAYSPGASSGGSAALVASGVIPIAHANDGGGSIRIPAAACGLVGLKPSRGRTVPDAMDKTLPVRIISQGAVTRSVRDTARWMAAAERYYRNPTLPPIRLVEGPSTTRLRIGVVVDSVTTSPTDDETRKSVHATADLLAALGHHVEEAPMPVNQSFVDDFCTYWGFLAFVISNNGKRMLGPDFDRAGTDNLTRGLAAMYRKKMARTPQMLYRLRRTYREYAQVFQTYDVVLSPTLAHTTPELGYLSPRQGFEELFDKLIAYTAFTPLNNASGGPAISLPLHETSQGLPLASHFSANHGDERTLLELAFELEQATPWRRIQDAR